MFLEVKNTTIGYKKPLINGIDTALNLGDICLLIGNNGVGKTTLIKSILNQIPLLNGDIFLNGQNIKTLSAKAIAEQIAVVLSKAQVPEHFTVTDLISLGKYIHYPYYFALSKSDLLEVERIIENLNLSQYKNLTLNQLSDGNLQKAFIGRALAQNAPMIILDEPTTHLDEENKIIILQLLRKLAKEHNKIILFSSHDWRLAKEFADRIWLFSNGILDAGITEEILIRHHELLNPRLFSINENLKTPEIIAPALQREMLFSFLQKNVEKDLSSYKFEYHDDFWIISSPNSQSTCHTFNQILQAL